jgi:F0F1-type ATP synthase assembly protein I
VFDVDASDHRELNETMYRSAGSYELVLSPVLLGLLGYLLDRWLGTLPALTIAFATVAFLGACVKLYYGYKRDMDEHERGRPWAKS